MKKNTCCFHNITPIHSDCFIQNEVRNLNISLKKSITFYCTIINKTFFFLKWLHRTFLYSADEFCTFLDSPTYRYKIILLLDNVHCVTLYKTSIRIRPSRELETRCRISYPRVRVWLCPEPSRQTWVWVWYSSLLSGW